MNENQTIGKRIKAYCTISKETTKRVCQNKKKSQERWKVTKIRRSRPVFHGLATYKERGIYISFQNKKKGRKSAL